MWFLVVLGVVVVLLGVGFVVVVCVCGVVDFGYGEVGGRGFWCCDFVVGCCVVYGLVCVFGGVVQ